MKKNDDDPLKPVAARIGPENFDKLELWRYRDGKGWCKGIDKCAPIISKAHPHLSKPDELLVSYNVNTISFDMHLRKGDIYRPRFISLRDIL